MARLESARLTYYSEEMLERGFEWIATANPTGLEVGVEVLRMVLDYPRMSASGGYPTDVDLTHPHLVITAEMDPAKENNRAIVYVYSRRKLARLGERVRRRVARLLARHRGRFDEVDWAEEILGRVDTEACLWKAPSPPPEPEG